MSGTMMDTKPVGPSDGDSQVAATDGAESGSWQPTPLPGAPLAPQFSSQIPVTSTPDSIQPQSWWRRTFAGPDGWHAVPRWLLYLVLGWITFQVEGWLLASLHAGVGAAWWRLLVESRLMLAAIMPAWVMTRIENRPFGDFGLPARGAFGRSFWAGALWGVVSLSVLMLALRVSGAFEFGGFALHGARLWKFGAYYAVLFLITGMFEEFLLRGYSQWVLARAIKFWPAAVLLSATFGAIHGTNPGERKIGLVAAALIGFFFCLTLRRTGNLWWAVGFHMAWDWGESYFYSVPDSGTLLPGHLLRSSFHGPEWLTGGSIGPEGSYLIFPLMVALWVAFDRFYPHTA
jgi:membrane protease YdiL (CAAX protease family)